MLVTNFLRNVGANSRLRNFLNTFSNKLKCQPQSRLVSSTRLLSSRSNFQLDRQLGSSINDVTQIWTFFDSLRLPSPPIVTCFITKAWVLSSQKHWPPLLLRPWRHLSSLSLSKYTMHFQQFLTILHFSSLHPTFIDTIEVISLTWPQKNLCVKIWHIKNNI